MNAPSFDGPGDEETAELLRPWLDGAQPVLLGGGMEGRVYAIDDERIAKVWFTETADALQRLQQFYDALSAKPLAFEVPRVLELLDDGERRVTIERRLVGTSLSQRVADGTVRRDAARARVVDIVSGLAICASVVDLCRALGVVAIAEGVETNGQLDLLQRLDCHAAQGYL